MNSFTDILDNSPSQPEDPVEKRRASFRNINASLALEGLVADKDLLALEEELIQGSLTTEQGIAQIVAKYSEIKPGV